MSDWRLAFREFEGKVVLVTGASTGIGAAVASAFASCGARVVVHYNASAEPAEALVSRIREEGGAVELRQADLMEAGAAERLVSETAAAMGRLDILVNNAGNVIDRRPMAEISDELLDDLIRLNLTATFTACRAAVPILRAQGAGAIINTTSVAARMGGGPGTIAYGAAKGAVSTLTRGLARELAAEGIRVNAVAPGVIMTPLHERHTPQPTLDAFRANIPMGRLGLAEDCIGAYLFLASERLAGFITGQVIEVNGGQLMP